jgi:hypothetical protein
MEYEKVITMIQEELCRAITKHPSWPTDMIHGAAVVCEEAGELIQATYDYEYKEADSAQLRQRALEEAVQVGAMAIRFLMNFEKM